MGRGFCILLMVLSLCACGAKNVLPESESVSSQTECVQVEEESPSGRLLMTVLPKRPWPKSRLPRKFRNRRSPDR